MDYSYYPGCSLHSTAAEFDDSTRAVFSALDARLHELDDWNCCGASSAHSLNRALSLALPARNLALAQEAGRDVVMPCAACFNRHKTADHEMRASEERRALIEGAVEFKFSGTVGVRTLLDVLHKDVGLGRVEALVRRPLTGLKVVDYYGCLLVRPPEVVQFDDAENPVIMSRLLTVLGAESRPWSYATDCCGGGLALTRSDVASRLVQKLVARAREAGAEALVTSCPLCQMNLEMRQDGSLQEMPIFYVTELVGLAFGLDEARNWWGKHLIDPTGLLKALNVY